MPHPPGTIAIPTGDTCRFNDFWMYVAGLRAPEGSVKIKKTGANVADNLNVIVLEARGEWVWLIGDDHTFPVDIIERLLDHHVDIVAPLCLRRAPPYDTVISTRPDSDRPRGIVPLKECRGLMPVHAVGTAGMLIRKRVFERLAYPWFELGQIESHLMSEDVYFCEKARKAGFEVYVDCDLTMGHIGTYDVKPVLVDGHWQIGIELGNGVRVALEPDQVREEFQKNLRMSPLEFDAWRATYATMTDDAQRAFHTRVQQHYPAQAHGHIEPIRPVVTGARVLEVGGWDGGTAAACLRDDPSIRSWVNVEWTREAAETPATVDTRYTVKTPDAFRWWRNTAPLDREVGVLSHVIEHLSREDAADLMEWMVASGVRAFYIEAPLPETGAADWAGYLGTHVYEGSWATVTADLAALGFTLDSQVRVGEDRYPVLASVYRHQGASA